MTWNAALAAELGLAVVSEQSDLPNYLVGNQTPQDQAPMATVYSGHQFNINAGQLGDGRALLIAELDGPQQLKWEIQLKGAGPTPYSRRGDGRAILRSEVREYLSLKQCVG